MHTKVFRSKEPLCLQLIPQRFKNNKVLQREKMIFVKGGKMLITGEVWVQGCGSPLYVFFCNFI